MTNSFLDKTGLTYLWGKITALVSGKQDTLTFDSTPTANSNNPVKSSGIKTALDGKQATLTFDNSPTANSNNPVKSSGIKTYVDNAIANAGGGSSSSPFISGSGEYSAELDVGYVENWANTYVNSASATASTAEGAGTMALDECSHSEGFATQAGGSCSHAEGDCAYIDGGAHCAHVEGYHTIASACCQHVEGIYNAEDTEHQYVHITGIGCPSDGYDDPVRKNGFTVDWGGNGQFAGAITIADANGTVTLNAARLRALLALLPSVPSDALMPGSEPYVYLSADMG